MASGDLDAQGGVSDIFDSYVEAGVRRFQARHGLSVDGLVREQTLKALNVPAEVRLAQLRTNLVRLRSLSGNLGSRFVVCNIPAARIEAIEGGVAVSRHTAVAGKVGPAVARHQFQDRRDQFQSVLDRAGLDRAARPHSKDAGRPDYLTNNHIRIFDMARRRADAVADQLVFEEAVNYRFKQDPGDFNSLGSIRIKLPSKDACTCMTRR
jgi:murein L,D-transpeptidase YcbB/YkuD